MRAVGKSVENAGRRTHTVSALPISVAQPFEGWDLSATPKICHLFPTRPLAASEKEGESAVLTEPQPSKGLGCRKIIAPGRPAYQCDAHPTVYASEFSRIPLPANSRR